MDNRDKYTGLALVAEIFALVVSTTAALVLYFVFGVDEDLSFACLLGLYVLINVIGYIFYIVMIKTKKPCCERKFSKN